MKYLIIAACISFIISCSDSKPDAPGTSVSGPFLLKEAAFNRDTSNMIISINAHNIVTHFIFAQDSIQKMSIAKIKYREQKGTTQYEEYINALANGLEFLWNQPYDIKKDFRLTLNKYLDYCKAYNHDPLTFHKFLN